MTMFNLIFLSAVVNVKSTSSYTSLVCIFSSVWSLELYCHRKLQACEVLRFSPRSDVNIGWGVPTLLSVGVDRMLHVYRVRRPATVHQQDLTRSHGHGERGRDSPTGSTAVERLPYHSCTNPKRSAPPTWGKTHHPNFQAAQAGSWEPSLPASRPYNQSQRT